MGGMGSGPGSVRQRKETLEDRVLGFPAPLHLQRAGNDDFRLLSDTEIRPNEPVKAASAFEKCAADIVAYLEKQDDVPVRHSDIWKAMETSGHAPGTARRVIKDLQRKSKRICYHQTGYVMAERYP